MLTNISIKENILADEKYKYVFSVEAVNQLVIKGIPFREAYKQVGNQIEEGVFVAPTLSHVETRLHEGSIGNLCNNEIEKEMAKVLAKFSS